MHAFISHNKADKNIARTLASLLVADGAAVWFDEWNISAGDSITDGINAGLGNCTHFVIIWSEHASRSNWVKRELASALTQAISVGTPRVIPIVLDGSPLPALLSDIKHIPILDKSDLARELLEAARQITGKPQIQDHIREIVKIYNECIYDRESRDPFGLRACPQCGSRELIGRSATDPARDDVYYFLKCGECSWSEWTR